MADLQKLMEEIKSMTVLELSNFVKQLEEEFGVSAAAPVAVAAAGGAAEAAPAEEARTPPDLALSKPRALSTAHPRPSKRLCPRKRRKHSLPSSRKLARPPKSSNAICVAAERKYRILTERARCKRHLALFSSAFVEICGKLSGCGHC